MDTKENALKLLGEAAFQYFTFHNDEAENSLKVAADHYGEVVNNE